MITEQLLIEANRIGAETAKLLETNEFEYPCGFASVCIRMRKNGPGYKLLKAAGWRWSDYYKHWCLSAGRFTMTQSMRVHEEIARSISNYLVQNGIASNVQSRID